MAYAPSSIASYCYCGCGFTGFTSYNAEEVGTGNISLGVGVRNDRTK